MCGGKVGVFVELYECGGFVLVGVDGVVGGEDGDNLGVVC